MRAMNIKKRVQRIIEQQRKRLLKEKEEYEQKLRDTMSYYGCGGPYRRQEAAIERREEQLEELNDFERQLNRTCRHITVDMYMMGCTSCGTVFMTAKQPFDGWHECPTCRRMIRCQDARRETIKLKDEEQSWTQILEEVIEEQKEREQE